MIKTLHVKYPLFFSDFNELELYLRIFQRYWNTKFYETASSDSRVFPCGRTDMTKLIITFCHFAKAPKSFNYLFFFRCWQFVTNDAAKLRITNPYILVVASVLPQWKTSREIFWAVMMKCRTVVEQSDTIARSTTAFFELGIMSGN